jgi:hypothetical protein
MQNIPAARSSDTSRRAPELTGGGKYFPCPGKNCHAAANSTAMDTGLCLTPVFRRGRRMQAVSCNDLRRAPPPAVQAECRRGADRWSCVGNDMIVGHRGKVTPERSQGRSPRRSPGQSKCVSGQSVTQAGQGRAPWNRAWNRAWNQVGRECRTTIAPPRRQNIPDGYMFGMNPGFDRHHANSGGLHRTRAAAAAVDQRPVSRRTRPRQCHAELQRSGRPPHWSGPSC